MGGNGGGDCPNLSQSVCLCRHRGGTSGGVACCLPGWQADLLAGPAEMTVWVGGGVAWSVISVMICMDVSLSSRTRL